MLQQIKKGRAVVILIVLFVLAASIVVRLFSLQIVQGEQYRQAAETKLIRAVPEKAPRGEILDRYGRPLVTNRMGFSVVFHSEYIKKEQLNDLVFATIRVAEQHDQPYEDTLPITKAEPFDFSFPNVQGEDLTKKIEQFRQTTGAGADTSALDILNRLKEKYDISSNYSAVDVRKIAGVRYEMEQRMFSNTIPYTFANDVNLDVVTWLREQSQQFPGVLVAVEPIRQYAAGNIAAHILGRVGIIYQEEYEALKGQNYGMNDIIGKDGVEKLLEKYLRGVDGISNVEQSKQGRVSRSIGHKDAIPGNYAVLTLDAEIQKVLEKSLGETIRGLYSATAGSAVVIEVNSGEVLAMASYPTFDPETFNKDYGKLLADPKKPMWNRAISGQYAPGSTFKILTAIAALSEGIIGIGDYIVDQGVYRFYQNYSPHCWIYDENGTTHGAQNVTQAIENSCNYYFYDVGRRLGIDNLARYAAMFGLGEYTGIELTGEAKGVLASEQRRKELGAVWYPGDTLQAAIGQSDNAFTPIQLANYIATVAAGGKRYRAHLVKDIKSYDDARSLVDIKPEVVATVDMSPEVHKAVMEGMRKVSETGTASNVFANYAIPVGGKTGTASVPEGAANGLFVAFAPFDDPQIAIAIVIEHGEHGNLAAPIARDVIDAYMKVEKVEDKVQPYNQLVQ